MDQRSRTVSLTQRDRALIEKVYELRGCGIAHLHTLFWPHESGISTCYRRIGRLVDAGYLAVQRLPSPTGIGSGKAFIVPGKVARRLIASSRGLPLSRVERTPDPVDSTLFAEHHLATVDVRLALELACAADPRVQLLDFTPEIELRRHPIVIPESGTGNGKASQQRTILVPDGAFTLAYGGKQQRAWLEVDLATVAPRRMQTKLGGYLKRTGAEATIPVFFATTTETRAHQIARFAQDEAEHLSANPTIFFVTTLDCISPETILVAPIWQQPGVDRPVAIVPGSAPTRSVGTIYATASSPTRSE